MKTTESDSKTTPALRINSPGKVNLTLDVLGRRADGFHEIRSLVIGVGLFDTLKCGLIDPGEFTLACDDSQLATENNIVLGAAKALARRVPGCAGLAIDLVKRIPVGGGLGGGSGNAAMVLRVYNHLLGDPLPAETLTKLGSGIGSDVPLFFGLPSAVMSGRGERIEKTPLAWRGVALLVLPRLQIATSEVYSAWSPADVKRRPDGVMQDVYRAKKAAEISQALTNDLEPAVFRVSPDLGELASSLNAMGTGDFRVSGSGSTLFGLFDDSQRAGHVANEIEARFSGVGTTVVATPVGLEPLNK